METQAKQRFPYLYYGLCCLLFIIVLPFLLLLSLRKKYRDSIPNRFFPRSLHLPFAPHLWFHACSFGEMHSLSPIITSYKDSPMLITTITHTGFHQAQKLYGHFPLIIIRYLPFEIFLPLWGKYMSALKVLVNTEAELWLMLFFIAKSHNARTLLLNARISTHSFSRYKHFSYIYKHIFAYVDSILAQSTKDKERLDIIGARNVKVFGNLKILNTPQIHTHYHKPNRLIILAASTHKGEEELILEAFKTFANQYKQNEAARFDAKTNIHIQSLENTNPLLLIAPRHPERFRQVYKIAYSLFSNTVYFSAFTNHSTLFTKDIESSKPSNVDVMIIDTLGMLISLYAISDIVILGGSFVPIGGHNPLEPAFFHTRLISGKHIFNQYALFELVKHYVLIESKDIYHTLQNYKNLAPSAIIAQSEDKLEEIIASINA